MIIEILDVYPSLNEPEKEVPFVEGRRLAQQIGCWKHCD